jgi:hypothetical protein
VPDNPDKIHAAAASVLQNPKRAFIAGLRYELVDLVLVNAAVNLLQQKAMPKPAVSLTYFCTASSALYSWR